jgi:hypothetical protein
VDGEEENHDAPNQDLKVNKLSFNILPIPLFMECDLCFFFFF